MGRRSILFGENLTTGTGNVLVAFQTTAAGTAGSNVRITRVEIGQAGSTTLAMVRAEMATRDTAGTLTMTSLAPKIIEPVGGAASAFAGNTAPAGGTGRSGINSSADSGGTYTTARPFMPFANTAGMLWQPTPNQEIWVPPSTLFVVRLLGSPTAASAWAFLVEMEEAG